jgi:hypothetical protein
MTRFGETRFGETRFGTATAFDVGTPPGLEGRIDETVPRQDIDVPARDQFARRVVVGDGDGGQQSLAGASVEWTAAPVRGGAAALSDADAGVSVEVTDAAAGELTISVATDATADLAGGRYHHEVDVVSALNERRTVCEGWLHVRLATTPPSP